MCINVLQVSDYFFSDELNSRTSFNTGYGHMVFDISESISNSSCPLVENIFLLGVRNRERQINRKIKSIIVANDFCGLNPLNSLGALKRLFTCRLMFKNATLTEVLLWIYGYLVFKRHIKLIKKSQIVHIHGITPTTFHFIDYCLKNNVKSVLTLHGLNSFSNNTNASKYFKYLETTVLERWLKNNGRITCVSAGVKRDIDKFNSENGFSDCSNVIVIPNGVSTPNISCCPNNGSGDDVHILCVGNISARKNQVQLIRAAGILKKKGFEKFQITLIGRDTTDGLLSTIIKQEGVDKNVTMTGPLARSEVYEYINACDFTICCSLSEGFGLPIIEGFMRGKPALLFEDLDAVDILYSPESTFLIKRGSNEDLANGIMNMSSLRWSCSSIVKHSQKFSLKSMSQSYIRTYGSMIDDFVTTRKE